MRRLVPGQPIVLTLVAIATLFISCSDDTQGGCKSSCARAWKLCESEMPLTEADFQTSCDNVCNDRLSTNAREAGQDLRCLSLANDCNAVRQCPTIGPIVGAPSFGGFAGFAGGVGGFAECQNFTTLPCLCSSGLSGTQQCQNSSWGPCVCSGSGGSTGCSDTCFYSNNGLCDDGGPNSDTARCSLATDCSDCGVRTGVGGFGGTFGGTGGGLSTGGRSGRDASTDGSPADSGDAADSDGKVVEASTSDARSDRD